MIRLDLPLPTIELPPQLIDWAWPLPPFAGPRPDGPVVEGGQPCRIETVSGATVTGQMEDFDPSQRSLRFRIDASATPVQIPFERFRRLTLTNVSPLTTPGSTAPQPRLRAAAIERDYCAEFKGGVLLRGRTLGYVVQDAGWFLFEPVDDDAGLVRHFVPVGACQRMVFEASPAERAAERWVRTPEQLREALAAQRHAPVRLIGEALLDLGLVTRRELERAVQLHKRQGDIPLGEYLVRQGVIDASDLQTALAYKMGYPLVDLNTFPIDRKAVARLSLEAMGQYAVLPLLCDGDRLVVAIDDLRRLAHLKRLTSLAGQDVVPVITPRGRLTIALRSIGARLGHDVWAENVPLG